MKRIISFAAVVMTMFMAASCSREQMDVVDSDTATMTLTVNMPDAAVTKAYGDGTFADKNVIIGVFDETGKETLRKVLEWKSDAFTQELDITLFRGKKYQMVFWAQYGNTYGESATMPLDKITVDYASLTGNLETRDAFYAYVPVFEVTGDFTKSVELVRPFAQVNFATVPGDIEDAVAAGLAAKGTLTVKNAAKTLDLFTGKTSDYGTVTIPETAFPMLGEGENQTHQQITVLDTKYDVLSMNYILVADEGAADGKVTTELTFVTGEVTTAVPNANMKRNYRTNVVGKLLTGQGSFTVTVDPVFGSPDYVHDAQAITHAQLQEKIAQGLEGTYQIRGEVAAVKATEGKTGYEDVTLKDEDGKSEVYTLKVPEVKSADTYSPYYKVGDVLLVEVVVTKGEDGKCVSTAKEEPYAHYPAPEEKPEEPEVPGEPEDPEQPVDPEQPGDEFVAGKYWIVYDVNYAMALEGDYGYLQVSDGGYKDNVFTFTAVEGGYTIQQADGKYVYMTGTYNSFNVSAELPAEGHVWTVTKNDDDTYKIANVLKTKTIQYDSQYKSYGSYSDERGTYPKLVDASAATERPVLNVSPASKTVAADVTEFSFVITSNVAWTVAGEGVTLDKESGNGNATVKMTFAANTTTEAKKYTATVSATGFDPITVTVTQSGVPSGDEPVVTYTMIDKVAELSAGTYYMAGYLTSYTNGDTNFDYSAYPYHVASGSGKDISTIGHSFDAGVLTKDDSVEGNPIDILLEAVSGKENTYYVKFPDGYLYSTEFNNRKLAVSDSPVEWTASDNKNGGITLTTTITDGSINLGTAGAQSNMIRSYKNVDTLKYGLVFFKKN